MRKIFMFFSNFALRLYISKYFITIICAYLLVPIYTYNMPLEIGIKALPGVLKIILTIALKIVIIITSVLTIK